MKKRRRLVKFLTIVSTVVVIFVSLAVPCLAMPADDVTPTRPIDGSFDLISSVQLREVSSQRIVTFTSVISTSANAVPRETIDYFDGQSVWCEWRVRDTWTSFYNYPVSTYVFGDYYDGFSNRLDTMETNFQYTRVWHYNEDAYLPIAEARAVVPRGTFVNLLDRRYGDAIGEYVGGYEYDYAYDASNLYNEVACDGITSINGYMPLVYVNASPVAQNVAIGSTLQDTFTRKIGDVFTVAPYNVLSSLNYLDREQGFSDDIWTVRFSTVIGLDYNGYVGDSTREIIYVEAPDVNFSFTSWLGTAISGFVSFQVFPGFSIGALLTTLISFSCVMWFLKLVAGG